MKYDSNKVERDVQRLWKENKVAEKIVKMNSKKKYYLLDGPPYVNGTPHVGHAKTTVFKDIWGKLKQMQGFSVWFQPGFDCGGLPIENKVEQELGIKAKSDIEDKIGVDKFIDACKKFAKGNEPAWLNFYKQIGAWRGWVEPYLTSENYYLESGWWTVKQWYEKGLLVQGLRAGFWCSHCETVLAGIEASESYKDLEDPSIYIKFPVAGKKNEYFLVWTTTPWTLPGNVAIVVHPEETYVKAKVGNDVYIIAKERLVILEDMELGYHILEEFLGTELEGMKYEPVLNVMTQDKLRENDKALRVYVSIPLMKKRVASKTLVKDGAEGKDEFGHMVTMDSGTGLVHTAPGHGDIDNKLGKHYGLPEVSPVDEQGRLTDDAGEFAGYFVKDADSKIIDKLRDNGYLLKVERITHSYPLCWRCKTPLIFRMSKQWFLKIDMLRDKIIKANKKFKWLPEFARERYHNTITEAPDWAVTRQRYWGIPLPVWTCESCKSQKVIGSREELRKESENKLPEEFDLHKNFVDTVKLKCQCGSHMLREQDIMDVWFDSGIAPWASLGYPFQNKELFERLWTVDLVDESQDQVKAWFDKLIVCGFATFDKPAVNTFCLNGWTLDDKGEKMSKSLGNVVSVEDAYKELGADTLRLYICHDIAPWETQKFNLQNANDVGRQLNILWNSYMYFKTYGKVSKTGKLMVEDKWILSKLNNLVESVTENFESFEFHTAARSIMSFIVDDFSRTYIKLARGRSDGGMNYTFTQVLDVVLRLIAPITPFISDYIYNDLFGKSVHLSEWPKTDKKLINAELEKSMEVADEAINLSNIIRKDKDVKLRWPLSKIEVDGEIIKEVSSVIERLSNVDEVVFKKIIKPHKKGELCSIKLDTKVNEESAIVRELMRAVQKERKQMGLVIEDKIKLTINDSKMKKHEKEIKDKVGAKEILYEKTEALSVEVGKRKVKFQVEKV